MQKSILWMLCPQSNKEKRQVTFCDLAFFAAKGRKTAQIYGVCPWFLQRVYILRIALNLTK